MYGASAKSGLCSVIVGAVDTMKTTPDVSGLCCVHLMFLH